ncbi:exported hypothetical protein [[Clostridium] ultunense Esp]|nr:exported hypothetical protein [[Clostridium] ultunense Esp]
MIRREEGYSLFILLFLLSLLLPLLAGMVEAVLEHREMIQMRLTQIEARKIALNAVERLRGVKSCEEADRRFQVPLSYEGGEAHITINPCIDPDSIEAVIQVKMKSGGVQTFKVLVANGKILNWNKIVET